MAEAKIHPPSQARIAEARAAGIAPRPLLVGLSAALSALALSAWLFGASIARDCMRLLRAPLVAFAQGRASTALALSRAPLIALLERLALCLLLVAAAVALGLSLAQGSLLVWPRKSARPLSAPRLSFEAPALAVLGTLALAAFGLHDALWLEPAGLLTSCLRFFALLAALFLALAVVDAAFARAQFFRALFLTRRELRDEQREAFGAPEVRAARQAARQQIQREEP